MKNDTTQHVELNEKELSFESKTTGTNEEQTLNSKEFNLYFTQKLEFEKFQLENRTIEIGNETLEIGNKTLEDDKDIRKIQMSQLYGVSVAWLVFTGVIVVLMGFQCICYQLESSVAIAFITTSLGTVLGLWAIALRYFFHRQSS
jgi:hypothetical protein